MFEGRTVQKRKCTTVTALTGASRTKSFKAPSKHKCGASQVALVVNNLPANAGDTRDAGSIPGSGKTPGGGHGNPLQYSCPLTEEPGGLQPMGSQRVRHN